MARGGGKVETGRVGKGVAVLVSVAVGDGVRVAVGVRLAESEAVAVGPAGCAVKVAVGDGGGEVGVAWGAEVVGGREVLVGRVVGVSVGGRGVEVGSSVGVRLGGRVGGARRAASPSFRPLDKAGPSAAARGEACVRRTAKSAAVTASARLSPHSPFLVTVPPALTLHLASGHACT